MTEATYSPILSEQSFNINHHVKVKLTERGRMIYFADMVRSGISTEKALQTIDTMTESDGYVKFQLWMLITIFSPYVPSVPTMDRNSLPFETEIILIPDPLDVLEAERQS